MLTLKLNILEKSLCRGNNSSNATVFTELTEYC